MEINSPATSRSRARRADIQRTLDALAEERQAIQGREADKSFERLAIIRSQDMRLEQEQQELELEEKLQTKNGLNPVSLKK